VIVIPHRERAVMPPIKTYRDGTRAAAHRPRCGGCGGAMRLTRIAPASNAEGFKVEYLFECACGEQSALDEARLWSARG